MECTPAATARRMPSVPWGVRGNPKSVILGRGDDGGDLGLGELRVLPTFGLAQHAPGGGDLDEVGPFLIAGANRLVGIVQPVDDPPPPVRGHYAILC